MRFPDNAFRRGERFQIGETIVEVRQNSRRVELDEVASAEATSLLIARVSGTIVGMLTLVLFRIPTGVRAIIEDVVVDEAHRGRGIAEALTREALARSNAQGARTVDLTSRPSREDANRLYQHLGFQRRDSNVYRFSLE